MSHRLVALVLIVVADCLACAPILTPTPTVLPTQATVVITRPPTPLPTVTAPSIVIPEIPGFDADLEFDNQPNARIVHYSNSAGAVVARFDPNDRAHNQHITWDWEKMSALEKSRAVSWLFDPQQMRYCRFQERGKWILHVLSKWIPRLNDLMVPTDPAITHHWQADGPPMNPNTIYEALSRVKALALVPERPMCSYGHSHLGLIEYGGEVVLFTAPGWQKVNVETREILTTVWTIKEAMVIYYPQSQGWTNSCPSEPEHLKTEYYSSIWLVAAEQTLAQFVPADQSYWEKQEIPFQIKNIVTQKFPPCLPPVLLPAPTPDPGCSQLP
ncbi:MAG: hypothetical protein HY868_10250 [Chloroflexi bacterium]|nr:hypothetical protein [Chloroflexota bacterium]